MPNCTVRYSVQLVPKIPNAQAMNAIGIFSEERAPDPLGDPGPLISRRLHHFSGPTGNTLKELVSRSNEWKMVVQERLDPLEWDS